jgi:hypothetical protein
MAYCTTAELTTYLGINDSDDDALLSALVDRATAIIDMKCKRTLVATSTSTRNFTVGRDTMGQHLFFDEVCAAITQVLNGDADSTEVTSAQYVTKPSNNGPFYGIKILRSASKVWQYSTDPEDAIAVTGNWGWFAALPDDVRHFCIRLSAYLYRQKDSSMDMDRPILTDAGVTLLPAGLNQDLTFLVKAYERKV